MIQIIQIFPENPDIETEKSQNDGKQKIINFNLPAILTLFELNLSFRTHMLKFFYLENFVLQIKDSKQSKVSSI